MPKYPPGMRRHPQTVHRDGLAQRHHRADQRRSSRGRLLPTLRWRSTRDHRLPTFNPDRCGRSSTMPRSSAAGWKVRYPYIADPPDGYFHKADTLAELAKKVMANPHQKMPLKHLEATVARYNEMADKGIDEDFEKPVMHKIETPPFYAAWAPIGMEIHSAVCGSTGRRRSSTSGARSYPASTPAARPAAAASSRSRPSLRPRLHRRDECGPGDDGVTRASDSQPSGVITGELQGSPYTGAGGIQMA